MIAEALRTVLLADSSITALVSSRIYAGKSSASPTFPLIVLEAGPCEDDNGWDGYSGESKWSPTVYVMHTNYDGCDTLRELVKARFRAVGLGGTWGSASVKSCSVTTPSERIELDVDGDMDVWVGEVGLELWVASAPVPPTTWNTFDEIHWVSFPE